MIRAANKVSEDSGLDSEWGIYNKCGGKHKWSKVFDKE